MRRNDLYTNIAVINYINEGNGRSVKDIANKFNISTRTVYRLLLDLQADFPLTNEVLSRGKEKLWTLGDHEEDKYGNPIPNPIFTAKEELILKYILKETSSISLHIPEADTLRKKLQAIISNNGTAFPVIMFPENLKYKVYPIENIEQIQKETNKETVNVIGTVLSSIKEKTKCSIEYRTLEYVESCKYLISPIFCFFYQGGMYLQALDNKNRLRTFAIERILSVEKTSYKADSPPFNPRVLLTDPFGPFLKEKQIHAKILISKEQVPYVKERKWSNSVKITDNPDGSSLFEVFTYGYHELKNWILSQTSSVEVLEPQWVRDEIANVYKECAEKYAF